MSAVRGPGQTWFSIIAKPLRVLPTFLADLAWNVFLTRYRSHLCVGLWVTWGLQWWWDKSPAHLLHIPVLQDPSEYDGRSGWFLGMPAHDDGKAWWMQLMWLLLHWGFCNPPSHALRLEQVPPLDIAVTDAMPIGFIPCWTCGCNPSCSYQERADLHLAIEAGTWTLPESSTHCGLSLYFPVQGSWIQRIPGEGLETRFRNNMSIRPFLRWGGGATVCKDPWRRAGDGHMRAHALPRLHEGARSDQCEHAWFRIPCTSADREALRGLAAAFERSFWQVLRDCT